MQEGIGRWHQSAGEEVPSHPIVVAFGLKRIHEFAMAENVHEESPVIGQPASNTAEQLSVISNMFEHFNRDDTVEALLDMKSIDVAGPHLDIGQAADLALRGDVGALAA